MLCLVVVVAGGRVVDLVGLVGAWDLVLTLVFAGLLVQVGCLVLLQGCLALVVLAFGVVAFCLSVTISLVFFLDALLIDCVGGR